MTEQAKVALLIDVAAGKQALGDINSEFRRTSREINSSLRAVTGLQAIQQQTVDAGTRLDALRTKARELATQLTSELPGGKTQFDAIRREYSQTTREAQRLERSLASQQTRAATLGETLRSAGVDTSALSREQARLAAELHKAGAAADQQRAKLAGDLEIAQMREHNALLRTTTNLERIRAREALGHYSAFSASQMREIRLLAAENDMIRRQIASESELAAARARRRGVGADVAAYAGLPVGRGAAGGVLAAGLAGFFSSRSDLELQRAERALQSVTGSLEASERQMALVTAESDRLGTSIKSARWNTSRAHSAAT